MEAPYLYRGTTEGWPGNNVLQEQQITCTTTDPLVATLFAIECRNHGRAVILAARRELFGDLIGPPNHFALIESAVNLLISPLDFARRAIILEVDEILEVLREIGFDQISIRIKDKAARRETLISSYEAGHRLNEEQLQQFNSRVFEAES
jgi:hypothetical protein